MNKWKYWNYCGLSITHPWIFTICIRWLFCTFFWQIWWIKSFPWCWSVFSRFFYLDFWCWSNGRGVLWPSLRVVLIVQVSRPGSSMAPLGCSSLVDGVVWHFFLRLLIGWEFQLFHDAIWFGGIVYLILEFKIFLHDELLWSLVKSWSWTDSSQVVWLFLVWFDGFCFCCQGWFEVCIAIFWGRFICMRIRVAV